MARPSGAIAVRRHQHVEDGNVAERDELVHVAADRVEPQSRRRRSNRVLTRLRAAHSPRLARLAQAPSRRAVHALDQLSGIIGSHVECAKEEFRKDGHVGMVMQRNLRARGKQKNAHREGGV
eukprot:scaffold1589_cov111-Isochrysis_galbana.AAC.2